LLLTTLTDAQVYEWRDADGNIHFGDAPPQGVDATPVDLPAGPTPEQIEAAEERLETVLKARSESSETSVEAPQVDYPNSSGPLPTPAFPCYTPLEEVVKGPVRAAYEAIIPTQPSDEQRRDVQALLAKMAGNRVGSGTELLCSGTQEEPREQQAHWDVRSRGDWQASDGLLILENDARSRRLRENQIRTAYLMISDALYFFESTRAASQRGTNRTLDLPGNAVEGLYLDEHNLAFKIKVRSWNKNSRRYIFRTELRLLTVNNGALTYSELYFHGNLLTGSTVWSLR
jgi:Domain of unknown function (DUF4124)